MKTVQDRLTDIDTAKGIAIFLVVLGHLTLKSRPDNIQWYINLEAAIYKFHMYFFMFISGFVMYYSFPVIRSRIEYIQYLKKKFIRLIPAFLLLSLLIIAGKQILKTILFVDNVPEAFWQGVLAIIIMPTESSGRSLWYIYVLFYYYLFFSMFLINWKNDLYALLIALIFLEILYVSDLMAIPRYIALNRIVFYALPFSIGLFCASIKERYETCIDRFKYFFMSIFLASFLFMLLDLNNRILELIIGSCSIPALHSLVRSSAFSTENLFQFLGKYSFVIYLLNTITIGVVKGIILKFHHWNGTSFFVIAPILLISGLFIPVLIKRYGFVRFKTIDQMTN